MGLAKQAFTPVGRGFNESLGYLSGAEDHYTHTDGIVTKQKQHTSAVDLWASDQPANGYNGTYSAYVYGSHATEIIHKHPKTAPLFLYVAFSVRFLAQALSFVISSRSPTNPSKFLCNTAIDTAQASILTTGAFTTVLDHLPLGWSDLPTGMSSALDDAVGNITTALKSTGMWENSVVVFSRYDSKQLD